MVHKVDLHRRNTPFGVGLENGVEVVVNRHPGHPEDDFHADAVAVSDEFTDVQIVVPMEGVRRGPGPSFVQQDVFHTELRGEIGIILIRRRIAAGLEVHVGAVGGGTVPPLPRELAGMDPTGFIQHAAAGQLGRNRLFDDAPGIGHGHPAPRERALRTGLGDVRGFLQNPFTAVAGGFPAQRHLRVSRQNRCPVGSQEQMRIVVQVTFADEQLSIIRSGEQKRRRRQFSVRGAPLGKRTAAVGFFGRCIEGTGCLVVGRETVRRNNQKMVVINLNVPFPIHLEPIRHAIVHYTEQHRHAFA